jgi:tetratricopeptide (TPR) repeat protein
MASQCYTAGRTQAAVRYADAGQEVIGSNGGEVPFGMQVWLASAYVHTGQVERALEWWRAQHARDHTHALTRAFLMIGLSMVGSHDEAMAAAAGLIDTAESTHNPYVLSYALLAYGFVFREADPEQAIEALRRGLVIARDSGNRANEMALAATLALLEAQHGDAMAALDNFSLAIRSYHDSGNTINIRTALAFLAMLFDRLACYEPAATFTGFAFNPVIAAVLPEINNVIAHLRDVLRDQTYESLAHKGETMTTTAMVTYAYDQIDQARAELNAVSK